MSDSRWLSLHVPFAGVLYGPDGDRIITELRERVIRTEISGRWCERWFFVRYGDPGPHIRLRVLCAGSRHLEIEREMRRLIASFSAAPATPVPYEPETDRYGGGAVVLSERVFWYSSEVAVELLQGMSAAPAVRLGRALTCWLVFLHSFYPTLEEASAESNRMLDRARVAVPMAHANRGQFDIAYQGQASVIRRQVSDIWGRLTTGMGLTPALDELGAHLQLAVGELESRAREGAVTVNAKPLSFDVARRHLLPSYTHMMCNRLGVPVPDEAFLCHVVAAGLKATEAYETS